MNNLQIGHSFASFDKNRISTNDPARISKLESEIAILTKTLQEFIKIYAADKEQNNKNFKALDQ